MNHVTGARFVTGDITTDTLLHSVTKNFSETKKKNVESSSREVLRESDEEDFLETPCKHNKISFEEFLNTYFVEDMDYRHSVARPTGRYNLMFEKIIFKTIHNGMLVLSQLHMNERQKDYLLKIYNLIKF